jgi:predicted porin
MKKSLIALAVLAAAGTASAQSSVTLFGVVDTTLQRLSNSGGASVTRLTNSGYWGTRLGFRGTEDLGGGMSASFWLEAGPNTDDGSGGATNTNNQATGAGGGGGLTFNRRSTVSLAGGWGEVRLGRDYVPQFWSILIFDPFATAGVGFTETLSFITGAAAVRASNSIGYFLPGNLGGLYGQVQYYLGENNSNSTTKVGTATVSNKNDGTGAGLRVGFANGPFDVAAAVSRTQYAAGDVQQNNIAGQWDFGVVKAMAQYERDKNGAITGKGWLIGGLVPVGVGVIRLSFSQFTTDTGIAEPRSRKLAVGYVHNLSKRTALYTTYARVRNSNGAASPVAAGAGAPGINAGSSGFDLGIRHAF